MKKWIATVALVLAATTAPGAARAADQKAAILTTYADIAHAGYEDSLILARKLGAAVKALIAKPSPATLKSARQAWIASRVPYMQTEAYRFGNSIVDDWEGRVNSWPLDEGLIDYVDPSYGKASKENPLFTADVIGHKSIKLGGKVVDVSKITKSLLQNTLQEAGKVEANVATGYHAIEFLLWGQDLNGTGPGAGNRPWTDYSMSQCTHGNCDRRATYLRVATELLIDDLAWMTAQWAPGGKARAAVTKNPDKGIAMILTGMGSLSYGEMAGQRMKLGLMLHDPEEEHDCFSDNTYNSHYYDALGIVNVYTGSYTRIDGRKVAGPSLSSLVRAKAPAADKAMLASLRHTMAKMTVAQEAGRDGRGLRPDDRQGQHGRQCRGPSRDRCADRADQVDREGRPGPRHQADPVRGFGQPRQARGRVQVTAGRVRRTVGPDRAGRSTPSDPRPPGR